MSKRGSPEWLEKVRARTLETTARGEDHGAATMTAAQVLELRARHAAAPRYASGRVIRGWIKEIAEEMGRPVSTINHAIHGATWSHL